MQVTVGRPKDLVAAFKDLAERLCVLLRKEGLNIDPYQGEGPRHFAQLDAASQVSTYHRFEKYVQICEETAAAGQSLQNDAHLLWRMFHKLRVHPDSGLMRAIEPGDIIEIYNTEFVQIFRNLPFFSICSYTLDDVISRPFWELFQRETEVTESLVNVAKGILEGQIPGVHQWVIPVHSLAEIDSQSRNYMTMKEKVISPLYNADGQVTCFVTTCRILSCVPAATAATRRAAETAASSQPENE